MKKTDVCMDKKTDDEKLTVTDLDVKKLTPNPWNPNRMSEEMRGKLKAYIEREGFVEPLVVRPLGSGYQILGGFHRWNIAKELGYKTVPCVVLELDDRRAKILTINLNEMKGQSLPSLLANLVHDLSKDLTLEDMESQLPYSLEELKDSLELLKIPDGLEAMLDEEVAKVEAARPQILSFVVEDVDVVEEAIAEAQRTGDISRGRALVEISKEYVGKRRPVKS